MSDSSKKKKTVYRGMGLFLGCFNSHPPTVPVIQSVFDHRQHFTGDGFYAPLHGNVVVHQTVEVLIAAWLPTAKKIGILLVFYRHRLHP
jgi:hypothetical protein